jgi:8-amino-7-oxononanoate synthase
MARTQSGVMLDMKRWLLRTVLNAKAKMDTAAEVFASARSVTANRHLAASVRSREAGSFSDLPGYKAILKQRALAAFFGIVDPFYRCHDERSGSEISIDGKRYTNFASYDYLGLNQHPLVVEAAKAAIDRFGNSVSASRIVAGERPLHRALEVALAHHYGAESAITFVSGHATNVSTICTLLGSDDLIVHDELIHNSVLVGAKLSGATSVAFRHNDLGALERLLQETRPLHKRALIVVEGLYSMDGDVPNLPRLVELKERYGAWLMVDEAHAIGVLGSRGHGSAEHFGLEPDRVDIWMGTLSKTLAACGGYIAGRRELIDLLKFQAPGLVYSVGLSPPLAAAAIAALRVLNAEPHRIASVQANSRLFLSEAKLAGLETGTSEGHAIVSVIVGDLISAGTLTERLLARGINVLPIIFPAVPLKASRLRFFITSEHTPTQIRDAVRTLRQELTLLKYARKAA